MPSHLTILFIGSNPSQTATTTEAFSESTKSGRILRSWIDGIEGTILFDNIASYATENNRPLNKEEMALAQASLADRIKEVNPDRLVALGKSAASVLTKLKLDHLEMPHPSGMNRKLNDRQYVREQISALKQYYN